MVIDDGDLNTTYNIGSGKPTTIADLIDTAAACLGTRSHIDSIEPPKFHKDVQTQDFYLDTSKLQELGFKPSMDHVEIVESLCL
jgi:nucleoside-diphosphate-sugar epimerase